MHTFRLALLLCLASVIPVAAAMDDGDTIHQLSTIDALLSGLYDGVATVGAFGAHGDLGLGTFDRLDGEMIVLDGVVYQAAFDGTVNIMPPTARTPFMVVTEFGADRSLEAPAGLSYGELKAWLEQRLPSVNLFYAVRIDGTFHDVRVRSVARQDRKPYPPLTEIARQQAVFERAAVRGTVLGFWCPVYTKGLNVPGFHLHLLSDDRSYGGHVLDFKVTEGRILLDESSRWQIQLPRDAAFTAADLARDRSQALHAVERSPGDQAAPPGTSAEP